MDYKLESMHMKKPLDYTVYFVLRKQHQRQLQHRFRQVVDAKWQTVGKRRLLKRTSQNQWQGARLWEGLRINKRRTY